MTATPPLLAQDNGSILQFVLATLPLFGVLVYFIYAAWDRPHKPIYRLADDFTDDQWKKASAETGTLISLMDILSVFLTLLVLWTVFAIYIISFIPRRRHLIGRYLTEGEVSIGDVHYDRVSRFCGRFHDYGYAIYKHPHQNKMIRKRVRVFQPYTREKVTILRLPNRPLSGQAKVDLEIDLLAATKERDYRIRMLGYVSLFWVAFTGLAPIYVIHQMKVVNDHHENASIARKLYLTVVGLVVPFGYIANWIRFLMYRNWMINRAAVVDEDKDPKKPNGVCIMKVPSEDGSEVIPYSILNEEECSYQGELPNHSDEITRAWVPA